MGLWKDMAEGFINGFVSASADQLRQHGLRGGSSQCTQPIENLCRELNWSVDERLEKGIILHFTDPIARIRKLMVTCGDSGKIAVLSSFSAVAIPSRQLLPEMLGFLLNRNTELTTGAWQVAEGNDGNVTFGMTYCALVAGMDAGIFKYICELIVKEVNAFDAKMKAVGLL